MNNNYKRIPQNLLKNDSLFGTTLGKDVQNILRDDNIPTNFSSINSEMILGMSTIETALTLSDAEFQRVDNSAMETYVKLPRAIKGMRINVTNYNSGGSLLYVTCQPNQTIDGLGGEVITSVSPDKTLLFVADSASNWLPIYYS